MVRPLAITLLRHGLTNENLQKKYVGWSDVSLCERGLKQLEYYKKEGYPKGDLFFISDLKRCKDTFTILYDSEITPVYLTSFREMNFGQWELKTFDQLQTDEMYQHWLENYKVVDIPDGENFCNFEKRVLQGWSLATASFLNNNVEQIVIISHGGPIKLLLEHFAPEERSFWEWQVPHGMGYTMTTTIDRIRRNERCISLQEVLFREKENGYMNTII